MPGFPRLRSFRRYDSITFLSYGNGCRLLDSPRSKLHRPLEGEINTVTVKRDVNLGVFSVERDSVRLPESSEEIGMDVGLDSFAALFFGREIPDTSSAGWHTSSAPSPGFPVASAAVTAAARPPYLEAKAHS